MIGCLPRPMTQSNNCSLVDLLTRTQESSLSMPSTLKETGLKSLTQDKLKNWIFFLKALRKVKVQMMHQISYFGLKPIKELDNARALCMPYEGNTLDMIIILPNKKWPWSGLSCLDTMEKKTKTVDITQVLSGFDKVTVDLTIPKFKVQSTLSFIEPLKKMGITDVFDEELSNLSGIDAKGDLFVSLVIQKVFIEVNEEGAEASAATAVAVSVDVCYRPPPPPPEIFICNRPFYYSSLSNKRGDGIRDPIIT